jgi:hypothetical protein
MLQHKACCYPLSSIDMDDVLRYHEKSVQEFLASQLPEDPLDPEYQKRVAELIQQEAINENMEAAMCAAADATAAFAPLRCVCRKISWNTSYLTN